MAENKSGSGVNSGAKIFLVVIAFAVVFVFGYFTGKFPLANTNSNQPTSQYDLSGAITNFTNNLATTLNINSNESSQIDPTLITKVLNVIQNQYVDPNVKKSDLYLGAIKGMVAGLGDMPSVFYTKEETDNYKKNLSGSFEGIGAELGYLNGNIIIKKLLPDSPASKSNIQIGDIIQKVDGESVTLNEDISIVVGKIRGVSGTQVTLSVTDSQLKNPKDIKITRAQIHSDSIEVIDEKNGIVTIRISRFTEDTLDAFESNWEKAITKVQSLNPKSIVLDLRGNPGGYLVGAYYVASDFLKKGQVVLYVKDRTGISETYTVDKDGRLKDLPMIVMVDGGSASASEILSGSLRDNSRSKLLGVNTYGKGSAQTVLEPSDWGGNSLHITVQKWLMPSKTELTKDKPLVPDIKVESNLDDMKNGIDNQKNEAIKYLQSK
ncbi:MAG: S41 family peptidase [bacterium]